MRLLILLSLVLSIRPVACQAVEPDDWAQYNYDNRGWRFNHAERTLGRDNVGTLRLKWHFKEAPNGAKLGAVNATPIVVGGQVYFGTADTPRLFKLDSDGKCKWEYSNDSGRGRLTPDGKFGLTSGGFYNSPLVTDDHVFAADTSGFIYCLNQISGDLVWKIDTRDETFPVSHPKNQSMGSPILANGRLIVVGGAFEHDAWSDPGNQCCTGRGFVVALTPTTGAIAWSYVLGQEPQKLEPPVVITDSYGTHTFHYGPSTSSIWSTPSYDPDSNLLYFGTDTNNSPRQPTANDARLATGETCAVVAIDASTGEERWVRQLNPGDVWNNAMRAYNPATSRYLDCSIGDTPKIYHVDIEGQRTKVVGVGCKNGAFYVLHAKDGRIYQHTPVYRGTPTDPPSPTPDKRMLAFPGPIGGLQTGCATDGSSVFANGIDWLELSARKRREGRVANVGPPTGGRITSISLDTRSEFWRAEMPSTKNSIWPGEEVGDPVASGIAIANGVVYFTTLFSNKLLAADVSTGSILFERQLPTVWSGPSISRGHVYVGAGGIFSPEKPEGGVFCFGL